jgi:tRNA dimethylallyltransferase
MTAAARLVVILGPTASGKSALGIQLAKRLGGEIVVCDSTQVYRRFDIGTAKVLGAEQQEIPHWMMDLLEPEEMFTAGDYRRRAEEILGGIRARGRMPVVTAGTGLYLRALLEGLADAPTRSEELRARLRTGSARHGAEHLHRLLQRIDPAAAAGIGARDTQKIIRAIEIRILSRKPVKEVHESGRAPLEGFAPVKIGLRPPRTALYERIDERVRVMFDAGWIDEVRSLAASGIPREAKPFTFIGYREILAHLETEGGAAQAPPASSTPKGSLDPLIAEIQQATRRFAKRQLTWFRADSSIHWLDVFGDDPAAESQSMKLLARA